MKAGESIRGRYTLEGSIGRGAQAETWKAHDRNTDRPVVLKVFRLESGRGWGDFDRFEAEARLLRGIDHPRIPDYLDQFELDDGSGRGLSFVLVQEHVAGTTIEERVRSGRRETVDEIRRIAAELLEIIAYLQSLSPLVIHRDINPRNVMIGDSGEVYLVDFGGVADLIRSTGETVIGTPGYTAIEQFSGRATPRSDLYSFAATILNLLTHRNPADLPKRGLSIDLDASCPNLSPELALVLESWLEPDERERTLPVADALRLLRGEITASQVSRRAAPTPDGPFVTAPSRFAAVGPVPPVPAGSKIVYRRDADGSETVTIPAAGFRGKTLLLLPFALFWNSFVALWTFGAASMGAPVVFTLFSLPFWMVGIGMLGAFAKGCFERSRIEIAASIFRLTRTVGPFRRELAVPTTDVGAPRIDAVASRNGRGIPACFFEAGVKRVRLGEHLSEREQQWLCRFIAAHGGDQAS